MTGDLATPTDIACRLCSGASRFAFRKRVLERLDVAYYACERCGSLETEPPTWLADAYAEDAGDGTNNLADLDTGAAQRNLLTSAGVLMTAEVLGLRNTVDIGGGDGLLCRLLRDYGLNAYVADRYAQATYARGFTDPDFERPDLVTAFEVMEHLADPATDLDTIFGRDADAVLVSTETYDGYGADWAYLTPETGQHVFFYGRRGLEIIGERYGYHVLRVGFFILFYRPALAGRRIKALSVLLRTKPLALYRAKLAFRAPRGSWEDADRLRRRIAAGTAGR